MRMVLMVLLAALSACSEKPASVADFALLTPRPFGYFNGDEIRHRIEFSTHNGVRLQRAGLPKPGARNRWLHLNTVQVSEDRQGDGFRYRIELAYQVFYAPLEVKMLTVPGFDLPLVQGVNTATQAVPAWPFTLSPLRELAIRKDGHGEYRRPDIQPNATVNAYTRLGLAISGLLSVLSAAYLGLSYGLLPGGVRRRVFSDAARAMAGLSPARWGDALTVFHCALNRINGAPLFAAQRVDFCRRHPKFQVVATELAWFFDCSERHFFAAASPVDTAADWARLQRLCVRCRDIERGL